MDDSIPYDGFLAAVSDYFTTKGIEHSITDFQLIQVNLACGLIWIGIDEDMLHINRRPICQFDTTFTSPTPTHWTKR